MKVDSVQGKSEVVNGHGDPVVIIIKEGMNITLLFVYYTAQL